MQHSVRKKSRQHKAVNMLQVRRAARLLRYRQIAVRRALVEQGLRVEDWLTGAQTGRTKSQASN